MHSRILPTTAHHALLNGELRDSLLQARQKGGNGDKGKGNACFGFFGHQCPRTTQKPGTTTSVKISTVVRVSTMTTSKAASTVTSVVASISVQQVTVTSKAVVTTTPTILIQSSLIFVGSGSSSIVTSNSGGQSMSPIPTGMRDSSQGSDGDSSHPSSSSFSLIKYRTTDENGYTIDATSTSFLQPSSTDSGLDSGDNTSNAKANSTSAASKGANVGAIVGGIVGAITLILFLLFAIWTIRRRKKNRIAPSAEFIKPYRLPFGSGSDSHFRHLGDSNYDADAQSISNFPFEPSPLHGTQDSHRSFFHYTREKSDIN